MASMSLKLSGWEHDRRVVVLHRAIKTGADSIDFRKAPRSSR